MSSKQLSMLLGVIVVVLLVVVGYLALIKNSQNDTLSQQNNTLPINNSQAPDNQPLSSTNNDSNSESLETAQTQQVQLPAIAFIPSVFSDSEKQQLRTRVLNPYIDWDKENPNPQDRYVAVYVERTDSLDYKYSINSISGNGGWGGFLYGNDNQAVLPLWTPDCMGRCTFSESFKKKYPEVVSEYNKKNP